MLIRLQSIPPGPVDVGSYEAEWKPAIGESIMLTLDADREQTTYQRHVHFIVKDIIHVAYNLSRIEAWMHPYNHKPTQIIVLVEAGDEHASNYLARLALSQ